eukprot:GILJ01004540.1.p1 GENE.GILJ01004540.1~~GILJ01004540.1.p1  ORF type:complete len:352 (-),score=34.36 GILJ01004540.1:305-1240(-)
MSSRIPADRDRLSYPARRSPPLNVFRCVAYSTALEYDIDRLAQALQKYHRHVSVLEGDPCIHLKLRDSDAARFKNQLVPAAEALFFKHGVVVFSGTDVEEEDSILKAIEPFEAKSYQPEYETISFVYGPTTGFDTEHTQFVLRPAPNDTERIADFLPLAHALARSTMLSQLENWVRQLKRSTKDFPDRLMEPTRLQSMFSAQNRSAGRETVSSVKEFLRIRNTLNLHSELLERPAFYHGEPQHIRKLYNSLAHHFDLGKRVSSLNTELDYIEYQLQKVAENLKERHMTKLEWYIIGLIMYEVGSEIVIRLI